MTIIIDVETLQPLQPGPPYGRKALLHEKMARLTL